jgi:hypothetical protein
MTASSQKGKDRTRLTVLPFLIFSLTLRKSSEVIKKGDKLLYINVIITHPSFYYESVAIF